MKLTLTSSLFCFLVNSDVFRSAKAQAQDECQALSLETHETIGLKVEKVASIPVENMMPFRYNMSPMDNFDGNFVYFLDQKYGRIYSLDATTNEVNKVLDVDSSKVPDGLTLDYVFFSSSQTYRVKSMTKGSSSDEVIVVFTSTTLPDGWDSPDAFLPAPGAFATWACGPDPMAKNISFIPDLYRPGFPDGVPTCFDFFPGLETFKGYDVFAKYTIDEDDGSLVDPKPFFVREGWVSPGHLGGGIVTLNDGNILYSTGDCAIFGTDGGYAPQLDQESCGKILKIFTDGPKMGEFEVVAKGIRNSQQFRIITQEVEVSEPSSSESSSSESSSSESSSDESRSGKRDPKKKQSPKKVRGRRGARGRRTQNNSGDGMSPKRTESVEYLAFMDIGGVTAEEVNAIPLTKVTDPSNIDNFGWGRNIADGKAREGTFYVNHGNAGVLGTEPTCAGDTQIGEPGFIQPWIQFNRTPMDFLYGIASLAIPTSAVNDLKLIWSEFNTGKIMGTTGEYVEGGAPRTAFKLKLYDENGELLENDLNTLVMKETGDEDPQRGDPRLFHFPNGQAGVMVERTGSIYKLYETKS